MNSKLLALVDRFTTNVNPINHILNQALILIAPKSVAEAVTCGTYLYTAYCANPCIASTNTNCPQTGNKGRVGTRYEYLHYVHGNRKGPNPLVFGVCAVDCPYPFCTDTCTL